MKNYIKPEMELSIIELNQNIASAAGLQDWLESEGAEYTNVNITHYELIS